jgi:hypothetical protein
VLRVGGACWGYICLHREPGPSFSRQEINYVHRVAPHLAEGIRAGLSSRLRRSADVADAPGLVVLASDGSLLSTTEAGELWLDELGQPDAGRPPRARRDPSSGREIPRD